jgi:cbb3-type cytochrome oxidase subunit 3
MRLSEMVSGLSPTIWTEIALVICLTVFAGVLVYALGRGRRAEFDRARHLPLDDSTPDRGEP